MGRSKGSRLKGWIESPNALRWRLGELLGCAFTETESSKIIIDKLGPRIRQRRGRSTRQDHASHVRDGSAKSA
jgi:hypothetical protein